MIDVMRRMLARGGRRSHVWGALIVAVSTMAGACGNKGNPRPPEYVRPQRIDNLEATAAQSGIRLTWTRPTETVDGSPMPDLDGFVVSRALATTSTEATDAPRFETIATIHLDDRERFAKVRRVTYDDVRVVPGETYLYRVVAFTLDGYVGAPSRLARAQWSGPGAEPASE
jgi:hypothetical protein